MKHTVRLISALCLALALLLFAGVADAAAFAFRGITWDSSVAQMMEAEGLTEGDGKYNYHYGNGYDFYYLKAKNVYYVFRSDQPVIAYTVLSGGAYAGELENKTAAYGAPAEIGADTVCALINAVQGAGTVSSEDLANLAAWRLSDGTLAALFGIGGDTYMVYFQEQRI